MIVPDFLFLCFWKGALTVDKSLSIGGRSCVLSLEIPLGVFVCVSVERCRNLLFTCEIKHFYHFCFCFLNCMCTSVSLSFLALQIRGSMNWYRQDDHYLHSLFSSCTLKHGKQFGLNTLWVSSLFSPVISQRTKGNVLTLSQGRFHLCIGKNFFSKRAAYESEVNYHWWFLKHM